MRLQLLKFPLLLEPRNGTNKLRVGDHGMTLMRLTYSYDLDTVNKQRIFNRILAENRILEADGRLYIETEPDGRPSHRRPRRIRG